MNLLRLSHFTYDLIIMDLLLPRRKKETATDVSEEIVEHIANSELNRLTTVVAISHFEDVVPKRQEMFARRHFPDPLFPHRYVESLPQSLHAEGGLSAVSANGTDLRL